MPELELYPICVRFIRHQTDGTNTRPVLCFLNSYFYYYYYSLNALLIVSLGDSIKKGWHARTGAVPDLRASPASPDAAAAPPADLVLQRHDGRHRRYILE